MDLHTQEALDYYYSRRGQLGARSAAAATCQMFGITPAALIAAIQESHATKKEA